MNISNHRHSNVLCGALLFLAAVGVAGALGCGPTGPTAQTRKPTARPLSPKDKTPVAGKNPNMIAVLEFRNYAGLSDGEVEYVTDVVRGQASTLSAANYIVMTRESITEMLPPGTDLARCEENAACEVEIGRKLGAEYVVTGRVIRFGSKLKVSMKIHNTGTSRLVASISASSSTVDGIERPVVEAAKRMFHKLQPAAPGQHRPTDRENTSVVSWNWTPDDGLLTVTSNYEELAVELDGVDSGKTTPAEGLKVAAGRRKIRLSHRCYHPEEETVTVGKGERKEVRIDVLPRKVSLRVAGLDNYGKAVPVEVYVDGEHIGTTDGTSARSEFELSVCADELVLISDEHGRYRTSLTMDDSQVTEIREHLKGGRGPEMDEVQQPGTELYWKRCPLGESWDGSVCTGSAERLDWYDALDACPNEQRLPTAEEFMELLGNCREETEFGVTATRCSSCVKTDTCYDMFGKLQDTYWSSTEADTNGGVMANLHYGWVSAPSSSNTKLRVRCVRPRPTKASSPRKVEKPTVAESNSGGEGGGTVSPMSSKGKDGLSKTAVKQVIGDANDDIQGCYERELLHRPGLAGRIIFEWTINTWGRVEDVRVRSSTLGSSKVASCVMQVLKELVFPPPFGGALKLAYPYMFRSTPKGTASGPAAGTLSPAAIKTGIRPVEKKAQTCSRYAKGTVWVQVTVAGSTGNVTSAKATGEHAADNAGRCVSMLARTAKFPTFAAQSQSFTHPIVLR